MNLTGMVPENTLKDFDAIPKGYLERIVSELAARDCEPENIRNNLIRMILLMYQADDINRWAIADTFIRLIYRETDEFEKSLATHVQQLSREYMSKPKTKGRR